MNVIKNILAAIGALFILLLVIYAVTGGGKKAEAESAASVVEAGAPAAVLAEAPPAAAPVAAKDESPELSVATLVTAYQENTVAADNHFKGKQLKVSGVVSSINTNLFGDAYITFKAGNEFMAPQATFADKQAVANLKKGDKVKLSCVGAGDVAKTPMLKDCSLI